MIELKKRGLSPVIASVLLIAIALVVATMIFIWAKNFVKEKTLKFDEPIENSCQNVKFSAEADLNSADEELTISVNNIGNVAIYGAEIRRKIAGSNENLGAGYFDNGLSPGIGKSIVLDVADKDVRISDELSIIPILLGETKDYNKPHVCSDEFAQFADVN